MAGYTPRERFFAAINHEEPDRVPIDLMGNATMLLDDTYFRLRDHLGLDPIPPARKGATANYYDERILKYFDIDFRRVFLKSNPETETIQLDNDTYLNGWGIGFQRTGLWVNATISPLHGATTVKEVEAFDWPTAERLYSVEGLAEEAKRLYEETDYVIVARNPLTYGFLDRCCTLQGMEEFFMTLALAPEVAEAMLVHILEIYKGIYGMFLDAVGPYVQMVETGDDLGGQNNPLISPKMYQQFIKPCEQALHDLIREKTTYAAIFRHTDGAIFSLIPHLIEVGVDVLNPVQTSSQGMEAVGLKQAYGQNITFHGAVEGFEGDEVTTDQIVAHVKRQLEPFAPGGGYILGTCNHMINVKPENIIALFEAAHEFGRYS